MNQLPLGYHRLVRVYYQVRASAFAALFVAIAVHMWGQPHGAIAWTLLVLQFLAYPHLLFLYARHAEKSLDAEFRHLMLDSALVGVWAAALGFPIWIAFTLFLGTTLSNAINGGARGAALALLAFGSGALSWGVLAGFRFLPDTALPVTVLCLAGLSIYVVGLGIIVFAQNRKLRSAREALRQSEERYRLITEHAGDLIAVLDAQGHVAYASPSYRRLLAAPRLAPGDDALAYVHEGDREAMRASLGKAVRSGESLELPYRLTAADGSTREFQATVKPLMYESAPKALVVSIDVTELRRRDKVLEVQAKAFENMAEAMMITSADGNILSVNHAFETITGYNAAEVVARPESDFRLALQPAEFYDEIHDTLVQQGYWAGSSWCHRRDTSLYREWRSISVIRDKRGQITHYVSIFMDISEPPRSVSPAHRAVANAL